eukprot:CAMPEP_0173381598 /NCGR_PEP_ID=MMETSP1356-20130122/3995_1 /TAXON_ID=77927 ORGANISM="Hemiselmis virescens, Strain PCC157" /NCGR_SAMPLE_ID=MMETSP1356 /ASSEMBLY_ACC=CAM_ASM_000847 /LENGTH=66 /DNA_ID=CAMNT_0014335483 /DNA_START=40 /DNA_END=236 /DNA_ORIENTATION=-
MSPLAVTMYWPVLFDPADPPFFTLTASALVLGSRFCHEATSPFRVPFSSIVVGSHSLTVSSSDADA